MLTEKTQKNPLFCCEPCDFMTNNKKDFRRHILTSKHEKLTTSNKNNITGSNIVFTCKICNKIYKSRVGLWSHSKKCVYMKETVSKNDIMNELVKTNQTLILEHDNVKELIKQNQSILMENQEFKKMLLDLVSKPSSTITNNNNITKNTNSHNKQFNLQFFLNDTCKNAMNMTDFVNSLEIKSSELEDMGKLGYVKGLSNIFIRALKELDETDRPMHCTDLKRETLYIKDNNVWEKETDDNLKLKKIITYIADKNFRRIPKWKLDNPKSDDIMSQKHMEYISMLSQIMSGISLEDPAGVNKIIRNVANEVCIDSSYKLK